MGQGERALSGRELALARRKAMSTRGKAAIQGAPPARSSVQSSASGAGAAGRDMRRVSSYPVGGAQQTMAGNTVRAISRARRQALSSRGKAADTIRDRTRADEALKAAGRNSAIGHKAAGKQGDPAGGQTCRCGCKVKDDAPQGEGGRDAAVNAATGPGKKIVPVRRRQTSVSNSVRGLALARRKALSARGKAALNGGAMSEAQAAKAGNPGMSGREVARLVREQRSRRGGAGLKKSPPCGRQRSKPGSDKLQSAAAQDAPWKVGASETSHGQVVTGTIVGRSPSVTGDEPSTCRPITGTEYLGAEIFRDFCRTDVPRTNVRKVAVTSTSHGNPVTGNRVGRSSKVTGNEPGTCKKVTGDEYLSAEDYEAFCGASLPSTPRKISMAETMKGKVVTGDNVGRSAAVTGDEYGSRRLLTGTQYTKPADEPGKAPEKVGVSTTLHGRKITGTEVGRRERMTGLEMGDCRNITGDDYLGREHFMSHCDTVPPPGDEKVGESKTLSGQRVTGNMVGRSQRVTGDEPGTCKAVTGTPYTGEEDLQAYCEPAEQAETAMRAKPNKSHWGKPVTGGQPDVTGLTGADKGACETVSGTPYVGADQVAQICPGSPAEPGSPDFPQMIDEQPWGEFSVEPPGHAARHTLDERAVTGSRYGNGQITGAFSKALGKVTGTEQMRYGRHAGERNQHLAGDVHGRVKARITGEGQDAGLKITGDDWERGERVTGTEGSSSVVRNATLRGQPKAMGARAFAPEKGPEPVSKVTGSSGNTEKGSLVTYSGGARG